MIIFTLIWCAGERTLRSVTKRCSAWRRRTRYTTTSSIWSPLYSTLWLKLMPSNVAPLRRHLQPQVLLVKARIVRQVLTMVTTLHAWSNASELTKPFNSFHFLLSVFPLFFIRFCFSLKLRHCRRPTWFRWSAITTTRSSWSFWIACKRSRFTQRIPSKRPSSASSCGSSSNARRAKWFAPGRRHNRHTKK